MSTHQVINEAVRYVSTTLGSGDPGHDIWHVQRVRNYALYIGKKEAADIFVVELAALFHDIADYKFHDGDETVGPQQAFDWLRSQDVPEHVATEVASIIQNMNFKGSSQSEVPISINHAVVQDADRLDALGAIGVARAFSFGGFFRRTFYDPNIQPRLGMTRDEYRQHKGTVINHFFEKLLQLEDRMLTETGRQLAKERMPFLKLFLDQFLEEWKINFEGLADVVNTEQISEAGK